MSSDSDGTWKASPPKFLSSFIREERESPVVILVAVKQCVVSFKDTEGFRHSVEIQAESLYEAAAMAAHSFNEHGCAPGTAAEIQIEVRAPSVIHSTTMKRVTEWIDGGAKGPREKVLKDRLKGLMSALPGV